MLKKILNEDGSTTIVDVVETKAEITIDRETVVKTIAAIKVQLAEQEALLKDYDSLNK